MTKYKVVIEEPAQGDVQDSYGWGYRRSGKERAEKWARELRAAVLKQLRTVPAGFPRAPEDEEFEEEIRQMIVGRYRVLFTIRSKRVHVLHVRGPYVGSQEETRDG